jgi:sulfide:quinone oxidoreductase
MPEEDMDLRPLTPDFAVAPQIALEDVAEAARLGFRTLINNRPDDEIGADLADAAMRAAAEAAGLAYVHLPYWPGQLTADLLSAFDAAMEQAQGPVLAWCRSGTRSSHLWAMNQAGHLPLEEILDRGAKAGYDLSALAPMLRAKAANASDAG